MSSEGRDEARRLDEPTVLTTRALMREARRDVWRYALGGAVATALIASVAAGITVMVMRASPPAAPVAVASSCPPAPPAASTQASVVAPPAEPEPAPLPAVAVAPPAAVRPVVASNPYALGALTVVCVPRCTSISDNGTELGPGHIFNRPTAVGRHSLVLTWTNGTKRRMVVEVRAGVTTELRAPLEVVSQDGSSAPRRPDVKPSDLPNPYD